MRPCSFWMRTRYCRCCSRRAHGHAHALARNDVAAEKLEQLGEARVARGLGNGAMEGEVLVDGALAPVDGSLDVAQGHGRWGRAARGVMRSAASAAASTSMARRSSITSSTSPIELRPSGSMRKGTRLASAATKAPEPWRVVTRPSARSAATASRTTVRLTPMASISSCSVGRRAPGASRPLRISLGDARDHLLGEVAGRTQAAATEPACQRRARRLGSLVVGSSYKF